MRIVLRIGGSIIASPLNSDLMIKYVNLLRNLNARGHNIAVVVGGGTTARELISAARELGLNEEAQDEIAISMSRILAQLFSKKLGKTGSETVPITIQETAKYLECGKIVVMGGLKPGMTTDTVAALIAEKVRADLLVKATNRNGVYDKDPAKHPDAAKLDHLKIKDLPHVFTEEKHKAGIHQIVDPEAVKILKRFSTKVIVVNGFDPENVLRAVEGKKVGTLID